MNNQEGQGIILVVDDSSDTLSFINDTLEAAGFSVLVALEGKQALTIAKRIRPDMILLDAMMPRMDGFETCKQLKQDPKMATIPVIFMTGLTETDNVIKGLEAGGVDYLTKPIQPDELLARMKVHLNNARITSSAYSALDSTGQFLFTTSDKGEIIWATPHTYGLLAKAEASEQWCQNELAEQLYEWMNHKPKIKQHLELKNIDYPLQVIFLGKDDGEENLFKLVDAQKHSSETLLQNQLKLTAREAQVLYWISIGKTNRDIGKILEVSPRTVNKHLEQIFPKLGVENRTAAARIAISTLNTD